MPLPSESFDLAVSEYGASIWCDPHLWIPEAHRLLRPGGRLWFLRNSTIAILCAPDDDGKPTDRLRAAAARARAPRVARRARCRVAAAARRALPPAAATRASRSSTSSSSTRPTTPSTTRTTTTFSAEWARKWPAEEIWVAKKPASDELDRRLAPRSLASTSPQRRAILEQLRIPFTVVAPSYVEHDPPDADPVDARARLTPRARRDRCTPTARHARRRHDRPSRRPALRQGCRPRRRARHARRARRPHAPGASRGCASSATASPSSSTRRPT